MRSYICLNCNKTQKYRGVQYANKFCNNKCQGEYNKRQVLEKWVNGLDVISNRPTIRKYLSEIKGYVCECCGISEWNGKPITLQVDHVDGNAGNNSFVNTRLICPNCHSQQENWGARNKGNGRAARGLPLY